MIQRLSELLGGALEGAGLEATSVIWQIAESWAEIVGPRVAGHAAPTRLRGGELTLSAPEAVWRQELTLLGPEIVAHVNQKVGYEAVRRIRLVSGPLRGPAATRRRRRLPAAALGGSPASTPELASPAAAARPGVAAAIESLARTRAGRLEADRGGRGRRRRG